MTIQIRHIVRAMPHGAGLRKRRGRLLKPVKPSHKVELWYKTQLLAIVAQLRRGAREELLPELKRLDAQRLLVDLERDVEPERAGRNDLDVIDDAAVAHFHDRAFAELLFDLS